MPEQYIMPIYNTIVGIVIGILVGWIRGLITKGKQEATKKDARVEATEKGIAILLRSQLRYYYATYEYQNSIPQDEWNDIQETHDVYNELGGNHTGDRLFEELKNKHIQA